MKRIGLSKSQLVDLYIRKKLSSGKIGRILGCNSLTVRNRLRGFEIPVRRYKVELSKSQLVDLYIKKKLSSGKIGRKLGCRNVAVIERLREFGIPIRSKGGQKGHVDFRKGLAYEEIYGKERAKEIKEKLRNPTKEQVRARLQRRIPSSLEEQFRKIVDKHDLPYKYVGNGAFILGSYNPDFINTNSKKIAIEVFARYYKRRNKVSIEEWKEKREQVFKSYGWKLLFFNETEVTEKNVLKILRPEALSAWGAKNEG